MAVSAAAAVTMLVAGLAATQDRGEPEPSAAASTSWVEPHPDPAYVLDHAAVRIEGDAEQLSRYEGQVVLIVNVASRCGFTRQYEGLQSLYETYRDEGFVILGFPANDFGSQEPGTNDEILEFCTSRFSVEFPMFEKTRVVEGEGRHPLYADLAGQPDPIGGPPRWNFTKFLVGRDGRVLARFESRDEPEGEAITWAVEDALAADG